MNENRLAKTFHQKFDLLYFQNVGGCHVVLLDADRVQSILQIFTMIKALWDNSFCDSKTLHYSLNIFSLPFPCKIFTGGQPGQSMARIAQ